MKIYIRVFGPEIIPQRIILLQKSRPTVRDAADFLLTRDPDDWKAIIGSDRTPAEGYAVLLNGRNILSLESLETPLSEGDELIFTVMVAGG